MHWGRSDFEQRITWHILMVLIRHQTEKTTQDHSRTSIHATQHREVPAFARRLNGYLIDQQDASSIIVNMGDTGEACPPISGFVD